MNQVGQGQTLLLTSITTYFDKHPEYKKELAEIVQGKSIISLRVIDWFITHYTRAHSTVYWVDDQKNKFIETYPSHGGNQLRKVHLYLEYRAQLKSYTKLHFDPFRRHHRISFVIQSSPHVILETTIGQLNFFRWAFQNHVLEYITNHLTEIEKHMTTHTHERKGGGSVVSGGCMGGETLSTEIINNKQTKTKKTKQSRNIKTTPDIIQAPCCLHFS